MNWTQFAINLAAPLALGSLIGAERQWRQRVAGLRTNALVQSLHSEDLDSTGKSRCVPTSKATAGRTPCWKTWLVA